jgi:hypothetical protein
MNEPWKPHAAPRNKYQEPPSKPKPPTARGVIRARAIADAIELLAVAAVVLILAAAWFGSLGILAYTVYMAGQPIIAGLIALFTILLPVYLALNSYIAEME